MLLAAKGVSLNPITSLYYIAPTCLVFLTLPWFFIEVPQLLGAVGGAARQPDFLVFFFNCICAFALNLSVFLLIGKTSALTMNVAGKSSQVRKLVNVVWIESDRVLGGLCIRSGVAQGPPGTSVAWLVFPCSRCGEGLDAHCHLVVSHRG